MRKKFCVCRHGRGPVDFASGLARVQPGLLAEYQGREDEIPGVFALMDPIPGAVTGFQQLANTYDTYILSTPSWRNPSSWSDKLSWVHDHLGSQGTPAYKTTHPQSQQVFERRFDPHR